MPRPRINLRFLNAPRFRASIHSREVGRISGGNSASDPWPQWLYSALTFLLVVMAAQVGAPFLSAVLP